MKYRRIYDDVVEAYLFDEAGSINFFEKHNIPQWLLKAWLDGVIFYNVDKQVYIKNLIVKMRVDIGDYIIKDEKGNIYSYSPEFFGKMYIPIYDENKKKKLFVSQPMNGRSKEELLKEREEIVKSIERKTGESIELIDSFVKEKFPNDVNFGLYYISKKIEMLSKADLIYFAEGWENDKECKIENVCALLYGIEIIFN